MVILRTWYTGVALAIIGVTGVIVGTADYGPGMSPDSISYAECAKSLLEGEGFLGPDGLYVSWPPLFPLFLAALATLGMEVMEASRWLNASVFGLIIFLVHRLFAKTIKSPYLIFTGAVTVLLLAPLLKCSMMVLTETLYTLFTVSFVFFINAYTEQPDYKRLLLAAVATGMACLTRYYGVSVILAGWLIIIFSSNGMSWKNIAKQLCFFGSIASAPLIVWMARNLALTESLTGSRVANPYTLMQIMGFILESLTGFILPQAIPLPVRILICAAAIVVFVALSRRFSTQQRQAWSLTKTMLVTAGVCIAFLLYSFLTTCLDPTADRYLTPVQFTIVFLTIYFLDRIWEWAPQIHPAGKLYSPIVVVLCTLWMGGQAMHVISRSTEVIDNPHKNLGWITKTASEHPEPTIFMTKGKVLCDLRRFHEAAEAFEQAAELGEVSGFAWLLAGKAYKEAGNSQCAQQALTQAMRYAPGMEEAIELLSAMGFQEGHKAIQQ